MLKNPQSVLFVCTGNTCRSPMAEYLFKSLQKKDSFIIASAGIHASNGDKISSNAMKALLTQDKQDREELLNHRSQKIEKSFLRSFDWIVVMEQYHKIFLENLIPEQSSFIFLLSEFSENFASNISDPIFSTLEGYIETMNQIETCLLGLKKAIEQ